MTLPDMSLMGWKVKDKLTGYTGIVQSFIQYYGGVIQADVGAKGQGTDIPPSYFIDIFSLDKVGTKPVLTDLPKHNQLVANLGDECEDIVSGFKGIVTSIHWYLNGCTKYTLAEKYRTTAKDPLAMELSILEARVKNLKPAPKPTPTKAKTGGPTVRATRF